LSQKAILQLLGCEQISAAQAKTLSELLVEENYD